LNSGAITALASVAIEIRRVLERLVVWIVYKVEDRLLGWKADHHRPFRRIPLDGFGLEFSHNDFALVLARKGRTRGMYSFR
jgi:hypothetical protein